jgi:gas vesicle protein
MASAKGLWFLGGVGIGVAIGLLYAPQSGADTREMLGRKTDEGLEFVNRKSEELRQQAGEYAERGKQVVERGKEVMGRSVERGRDAFSRQKEQFQAAVDAGKQAYRESSEPKSETGTL